MTGLIHRMCPRGARLAIAVSLLACIAPAASAEVVDDFRPILFDTETPDRLYIADPIDIRTPVLFSQALVRYPDVTTLVLSSQGGVVHYGLGLAFAVRAAGLNSHIPTDAVCASACAYAFFAGVQRSADGGLGVHRLAHANGSLEAGQIALADIVAAFDIFDVPIEVLNRMLNTSADSMYVFQPTELAALGLTGPKGDSTSGEISVLQSRIVELETALSEEERARLGEVAAAEALRARLVDAGAALEEEVAANAEAQRQVGLMNEQMTALRTQLGQLRALVDDYESRDAAAEVQIERLGADLNAALARVAAEQRMREEETDTALAEAEADNKDLRERLAMALSAKLAAESDAAAAMTEAERQAVMLAAAAGALEDEKAAGAEAQRQIKLLSEQMTALNTQLRQLYALLDDYESRDAAAKVQIERLGADLNAALARVAAEERRRAELEASESKP